ncbi:MAG: phosphate ABC transporter substrate-binding protein PstS [Tannerellaceae bacterium]|jgi:phosphate transport system substrate-binding protein|nr:phosphate ABC transporter substrate-binding protein PstS [Tannerellaceae bacterium]
MKNLCLFSLAVLASFSCGQARKGDAVKLSGAGATFPAPFYNVICKEYAKTSGNEVTYGGIGSGGGIRSLTDKTVDFGATDVFLSEAEMKETGAEVIHIPTALGAVVVSYNLKDVKDLKLTAGLISAIYRGEIKHWNDPRIQAINPGLRLPGKGITPVYRSDGSGTTAVFSEYMSKADSLWKETIGEGKSLSFPAGVAAKGNPGVAGILAGTEGSIGYIGSEYALALNLPSALLQNRSGNFVTAGSKNITASAHAGIPADTRVSIVDSPVSEAYPISTFTWIIAYREQSYNKRTKANALALVDLLRYIISDEGQDIASRTYYAPLPPAAREKAGAIIRSITFDGEELF